MPANAHPLYPSDMFDTDRVPWRFVYNRTSAQFAADFDQAVADGYMVIDLEIENNSQFGLSTPYRIGAVFQRNLDGRRWQSRRNMTRTEFNIERERAREDNLRLHDIDVYRRDPKGASEYAAVWVENIPDVSSSVRFDMTEARLIEFVAEIKHQNRMLVDIQEYTKPGCNVCYAAVSTSRNIVAFDWQVHWGLTDAEFAARFSQYKDHYRMFSVHSVDHMGPQLTGQRYAGIWIENRNGRGWMERRDMDAATFAAVLAQATSDDYRPIAYDTYWNGDTDRQEYAMVWRQND